MRRRLFDYSRVPQRQRVRIFAAMLFWTLLAALLIRTYGVQVSIVQGPSMEPALHDGQRVILWLPTFRRRHPHRGEVVAFRKPGDSASVKRVIALPGETVEFKDGAVFIAGVRLQEPYLPPGTITAPGALAGHRVQAAPDCYIVLGDNRNHSTDSRHHGAIPSTWIIGSVHEPHTPPLPPPTPTPYPARES